MLPFKFDTQLLIEGAGLCEDDIHAYIMDNIKGDSLLVIGDERLIRIHYHLSLIHIWKATRRKNNNSTHWAMPSPMLTAPRPATSFNPKNT